MPNPEGLYSRNVFEARNDARATVVIVDDFFDPNPDIDDSFARLFAPAFTRNGYRVISFLVRDEIAMSDLQVRAFADRILEESPDVVITDMGLGKINGIDLLEALKAKDKFIKTVLITGGSLTPEAMNAADLPLRRGGIPSEFVERINGLLGLEE